MHDAKMDSQSPRLGLGEDKKNIASQLLPP
jgi:hypothetical protein